jgi:pSer/pThr/pTyr-binding forkhead associated (FHA) protein
MADEPEEQEAQEGQTAQEEANEPDAADPALVTEGEEVEEEPADFPDDIAIDASEGESDKAEAPGEKEASITVIDPEGNETTFALDRAVTNIGREETNHIALPDPKCSRKHFVIEMSGDYYNAIDLNSTNGIRVNGHKVTRRRLRDGDAITIGKHKLVYAGPTDESEPDELADQPPPQGSSAAPSPIPEEGAVPETPVQVEFEDDTTKCPGCKGEIPPASACPNCGYKSYRFRAVENYVDSIARDGSLLGGLGLWKLKRDKVLLKAWEREDVEWVVIVSCGKCGWKHRMVNEFKAKCFPCEHCGNEVSMPVHDVPKLE